MPIPSMSSTEPTPQPRIAVDWTPDRERLPWTWMVSADRLTCRRGRIVPDLIKHQWTAGGLNPPTTWAHGNRAQGSVAASMASSMAIEVPRRMPGVTAFGQSRDGADYCYMDLYRNGGMVYACEAWERPRRLGSRVIWDRDEEGFLAFLERLLPLIAPDGLEPIQIEIATAPIIRQARLALIKDGPSVERHVRQVVAQLPREHIPADLLQYAPALPEADPEAKPRREPKPKP